VSSDKCAWSRNLLSQRHSTLVERGLVLHLDFRRTFGYWTKVQCTASQLFAKDYAIWLPMLSQYCHPERSEGSRSQILRFAQNDT
jgi:hypothetical protein